MKLRIFPFVLGLIITSTPGFADDGAITNKSMSRTIQIPTFDQEIVNNAVPEAEHAFTDMMGFYVPAQAASGLVGPIAYCDIDNAPDSGEDCTNAVEELEVAKPLVNVFIYGPAFGVEGTAFAHSFMDTYAAVSLDDGETWKQTNLSESADLSSFNLTTDHKPSDSDPLPNDHTIELEDDGESALHASGYDYPYTNECTECHGVALQGTAQAPSCYSCHESDWEESPLVELGPIVTEAEWEDNTLDIEGENALSRINVTIINALTGESISTVRAESDGDFEVEEQVSGNLPPCVVAAEYTESDGTLIKGPAISVVDEETGEPIDRCEGLAVNLTEYPGGTYNVFHATAGNKTLVAWPSRFCQTGQPAYALSTDLEGDTTQLEAITNFIREGDTDLGVGALPDFTSPIDGDANNDLYLTDAFGVAGSQGSIDFADEGYPQAGVVPFGCVWTSRGVLLPGDDPRTEEVESSHMVWTKAERLTSGRRDPNRIEVMAVKDAGFIITWQEDPEGLRPGQGEGPGEGWSGAVAHPQTDVWYSFINWEYFDIVEDPTATDTTNPINILDADLTATGRPQAFVPMAVPMRITNNAKCNAPDEEGNVSDDLYCNYDLAAAYGLKDQCADTITVITGPAENPDQQEETLICVADTNGDGDADLVNRANTAATRPRLSLQGYTADTDTGDKSAWVVMAAEESKGLGKFFFYPDGINNTIDGYAEPCVEDDTDPICAEEIGKNQWYFSMDMGTPDTSAGIGQPNSLVENLVYQGNLLNQPEVYWETGEFLGLMDTAVMGAGGTSLYGDYDFELVNTEIARRASLLVQSIDKAVAARDSNPNGEALMAIPSWKQGPMRQGGPADTMLRRVMLPEGYGVVEPPPACPIDENVDVAQPRITSATLVERTSDGEQILRVTVEGLDGDPLTATRFRNALTTDLYGPLKSVSNESGGVSFSFLTSRFGVPCTLQAADNDGSLEYGPWIAVDTSAFPGQTCDGPIPPECVDQSCPIDANVDAAQPLITSATLVERTSDGEQILRVTVEGLDGEPQTATRFRNAVTTDLYGPLKSVSDESGSVSFSFLTSRFGVPCTLQAADNDGSLEYGPWIAVDTSAFPDQICVGPIPDVCTTGSVAPTAVLAATTEGIEVNPYAFENIACENWLWNDGSNPYYPKGVCLDSAINLSGVKSDTCVDDADGSTGDCPAVDCESGSTFCIGDTNPILQGVVQQEGNTQRVLTWHQCPSDNTVVASDGITPVECDPDENNMTDQSWYNPLDIAKGHRGFLDGNFVQFLYAWSPNWRLNAKGNDRYELYVRRSFDGGATWTTTPSSFEASDGSSYSGDGTVTCESYRQDPATAVSGELNEPKACYEFAAGAPEHARNVTQHRSMNITTLDPRYAPTMATIADGCTNGLFLEPTVIEGIFTCDDLSEDMDSDQRDPSRYFMVFEVGDNNTTAVGEAEPLDLFYSRAESFGDDYVVWTETDTDSANPEECYPNVAYDVDGVAGTVLEGSGFCNEFDNLNTSGDTHSSEANMEANPDGSKMYAVWAQWVFEDDSDYDSEVIESDAMARRVWWIDDYVSDTEAYTLPGTQQ